MSKKDAKKKGTPKPSGQQGLPPQKTTRKEPPQPEAQVSPAPQATGKKIAPQGQPGASPQKKLSERQLILQSHRDETRSRRRRNLILAGVLLVVVVVLVIAILFGSRQPALAATLKEETSFDCFPAGLTDSSGAPVYCQTSPVLYDGNNIHFASAAPIPGDNYSSLFSMPYTDGKPAADQITYQTAEPFRQANDFESMTITSDGEYVFAMRPDSQITAEFTQRVTLRSEKQKVYASLRDKPAVAKDGEKFTLLLNAGLALDAHHLDEVGAEGIGLFRTEFQFMVSETLPRLQSQTLLYRDVLDAAGDRPVTFRTLDLGGDKVLPYVAAESEQNPALGWRALRIGLDRPALLRYQLRALISAAAGRRLRVMFPLVTTVQEFDAARGLLDRELDWALGHQRELPADVQVGAMVEAPALAWSLPELKGRADFLSIGTNDLMQYFFAADRGNPRVADRYDVLSASALRFLRRIREEADDAGLPISICGEAAGRPLEALAFAGLGFRRLSMPAPGIGAIKQLVLSIDAADVTEALNKMLSSEAASLRAELKAFALSRNYLV